MERGIFLQNQLRAYRSELHEELDNILTYWQHCSPDKFKGGFFGRIDQNNKIDVKAPKGVVLNARILWAFSAALSLNYRESYFILARRAFDYIRKHFLDAEFGGVYWTIDSEAKPLDTKKQVYALAFTIYGMSEFYKVSRLPEAMQTAIDLYRSIIEHSYDAEKGGFFEAFSRDWKEMDDLRLSAKDANEKKTMNTHLHILEAFGNLYEIWPDGELRNHIINVLGCFNNHFVNPKSGHLTLFFDENWKSRFKTVSYGHEIEASWLLYEAARIIDDAEWIKTTGVMALTLADAAREGIDTDGGLWYEYESEMIKEKHWWVQAEAMVGFFNAWQLSGQENYLKLSLNNWEFVKANILDRKYGEWLWGVDGEGNPMPRQDKAGIWKCPYHNSRACIEIIKRIG